MKIRLLLTLFILFFAERSFGNMAEYLPIRGQLTGAPLLGMHCSILHEELSVDIQSVATTGTAHVIATYTFVSDTLLNTVQLVFVANNLDGKKFSILLDHQTIKGDTSTIDSIPSEWKTPEEVNFGTDHLYLRAYNRFFDRFILFSIPISKGMHILTVEYDAVLTQFGTGPTITYDLLYILSPIKNWKDYQGLDLKVAVPENWIIESNLQMKKEGVWMHGHWNKIPDNYVFLTTKYPDTKANFYMNSYMYICWGILLVLIGYRIIVATRKLTEGKNRKFYTWSLPVWTTFLGVTLFYVVFFNRENVLKLIYGNQAGPDFDRGDFYAVMGFPFLWIFALILAYLVQIIAYKIYSARASRNPS
ncbi:hypothetical protein BH09BAC5_BH09BAC5_08230 [soil metagenome]